MSLVVALDTMAWIWVLKDPDSARDDDERANIERAAGLFTWLDTRQANIERAAGLFTWLDTRQADIVVPAVSVAELLTPMDDAQQNRTLAIIGRRCRPAPFDLSAAALAATLYRQTRADAAKSDTPRHVLRADTLILATAKSAGATHFFTEDAGCKKLAHRIGLVAQGLDDDPTFALPIESSS